MADITILPCVQLDEDLQASDCGRRYNCVPCSGLSSFSFYYNTMLIERSYLRP
jgi:hypothetical protein